MTTFELLMPSEGDMELLSQENGKLTLKPIYYGGECYGPIIRTRTTQGGTEPGSTPAVIETSYRLKIRQDGKVTLMKADTDEA